jgi:hypothetical protein
VRSYSSVVCGRLESISAREPAPAPDSVVEHLPRPTEHRGGNRAGERRAFYPAIGERAGRGTLASAASRLERYVNFTAHYWTLAWGPKASNLVRPVDSGLADRPKGMFEFGAAPHITPSKTENVREAVTRIPDIMVL